MHAHYNKNSSNTELFKKFLSTYFRTLQSTILFFARKITSSIVMLKDICIFFYLMFLSHCPKYQQQFTSLPKGNKSPHEH